MTTELEQLNTVKALEHVASEGTLTGALSKAKGRPKNTQNTSTFDLPPIDKFKKVLKKAGVNEKYVATKLFEMFEATNVSVDRSGKIQESPNHSVRLKAIEMWLKYYVPLDKGKDTNHLHLHGDKKLDDLLNKARRD